MKKHIEIRIATQDGYIWIPAKLWKLRKTTATVILPSGSWREVEREKVREVHARA